MRKIPDINPKVLIWLSFLAAVALMFYLRPGNDENRYIYEINRPWNYNLLTAPFDIPVHHDTITSVAIRDSLEAGFEPVYARDAARESQILAKSATRLLQINTPVSAAQRSQLLAKLRNVYQTGIIDKEDLPKRPDGSPVTSIRILTDDEAVSHSVTDFLTPREAYERLDSLVSDDALHNAIITARISELMEPNLIIDSLTTKRFREEAYATALAPIGVIQHGERIINRGDIVTPQIFTILNTYEQMMAERGAADNTGSLYPALGTLAFLIIILGTLMAYIYFFRRDYYNRLPVMLMLLSLVTLFTLLAYGMNEWLTYGLFIVPLAIVPVVTLVFLDSRTAFITGLITVLLCSPVSQNRWEFMILQIVASLAAVVSIRELSKRSQLIRTSAIVFLCYVVTYAAMELMTLGTYNSTVPRMIAAMAINAVLISFAYFIIFLIEKVFGYTSRVTLVELADINHPLLRELSEECPGTFNHSMSVSNLASAAAAKIGANVQLVRTGALYHDIGKVSNPAFFTENQHGVNPHDSLDPLSSARIVISHVPIGLRKAEQAKLPRSIRDFIAQHHGKGKARYFYTTYCNRHPDEDVDPAPFTYPGPNPLSREASVLMMADAVEAASRSLDDHSEKSIVGLVNKIIDSQISEGLHNDSPLSFRDVSIIKKEFISRLRTMYHSRISYPESIRKPADEEVTAIPPPADGKE